MLNLGPKQTKEETSSFTANFYKVQHQNAHQTCNLIYPVSVMGFEKCETHLLTYPTPTCILTENEHAACKDFSPSLGMTNQFNYNNILSYNEINIVKISSNVSFKGAIGSRSKYYQSVIIVLHIQ